MKVLIIRNAYRWQYGGGEQFSYNLAAGLIKHGHQAAVATRVPELIAKCGQRNIPTYRNMWLGNRARRLFWPLYLIAGPLLVRHYRKIITECKADVVIASSRDDQIYATLAARELGLPVLWVDHADMKHILAESGSSFRRLYLRSLALASRVVVPSQAETDQIFQHLDQNFQRLFQVILNGAVAQPGHPMERPKNKIIFGYAGRIERDKGLFDLIKVAQDVPEAEFWLAGKGRDESSLRLAIESAGLGDRVKLLGHLENVWDLLAAADAFVYPTHHDASPLAPAEAILAGLPVIATQVGGVPEIVADAGLLVPPHDPRALGGALKQIADTKTRAKLTKAAKARAKLLDFDTIIGKHYLPLLREILK